jgi:superfamily I DNA/RNA helicase
VHKHRLFYSYDKNAIVLEAIDLKTGDKTLDRHGTYKNVHRKVDQKSIHDPSNLVPPDRKIIDAAKAMDDPEPEIEVETSGAEVLREPELIAPPPFVTKRELRSANIDESRWPFFLEVQDEPALDELMNHPDYGETAEKLYEYKTSGTGLMNDLRRFELPNGLETLEEILDGKVAIEDLNILLTPEQAEIVDFAFDQAGPVLVRGGPGTGKSLIAQHRVKAYIDHIGQQLFGPPKILFTTYTKGLSKFSEPSLRRVLGEDRDCVEILNTDQVISRTLEECLNLLELKQGFLSNLSKRIKNKRGNRFQDAQGVIANIIEGVDGDEGAVLREFGAHYLAEEIESIIFGYRLTSVDDYLKFDRQGRKIGLLQDQRRIVWRLKEHLEEKMRKMGKLTYSQMGAEASRLLAAVITERNDWRKQITTYDAIVVDEAQDLDPIKLSILAKLAPEPNRLFVVADASQAIYRAGLVSIEDHEDLDFRGRVRVLDHTFRTSEQIALAATAYLEENGLTSESSISSYEHTGPKPRLWRIASSGDEFLKTEIAQIAKELGSMSSRRLDRVAILSTRSEQCREVVKLLKEHGIKAVFQKSETYGSVPDTHLRVMPLQGVKGIEFEAVYIIGLNKDFPKVHNSTTDEGLIELEEQYRRYLFVAMTRAIQFLTVSIPQRTYEPLFKGFSNDLWEVSDF